MHEENARTDLFASLPLTIIESIEIPVKAFFDFLCVLEFSPRPLDIRAVTDSLKNCLSPFLS